MKTAIYYFTGTGNSLKVARDIAKGLGETEIVSIAKVINSDIRLTADRIGIVFPVYVWGAPLLVVNFIKKLPPSDKYFFSVVTYGGMPAGTTNQINGLLRKQGIKLSAGFGIRMPGNYIPMYGAKSEETCNKLFEKENKKVQEIIEYIKEGKAGRLDTDFFLVNWLFSGVIHNLGIANMHKADKDFWVKDNCKNHGICAKVCPVRNIEIVEGKPQWQHRCEQCLACLQWCPEGAIQFGKKTEARKRYHHPEIKVEDLYR